MTKVRLLNDGGYLGLGKMPFPMIVDADLDGGIAVCDFNGHGLPWRLPFHIGSDCELLTDTLTPSTPQAMNLSLQCKRITEVSDSRAAGFDQVVTLEDACVDAVIEQIGSDTFFNAFDNDDLIKHLENCGYKVVKDEQR